MAVSGVSSSRSIYGNRNVITGLASGMDTESMIENAISAYKNKISALSQKRTKTEWKQDAYRSMISKMSSFLSKYTSYRSANNLMSTSFFDQAVKTVSKGANKDLVSAVGRASSDIRIDRVRQLATAATYKLSGTALDGTTAAFGQDKVSASASGTLDLDKEIDISKLNGSLTLAYGGANAQSYLTVNFDETKTYANADELVAEINKQLEGQSVSIGTKTYTGKELLDNVVKAEVGADGKITFADPKKNGVYVSGATGSVQEQLLGGSEPSTEAGKQIKSLTLADGALDTEKMSTLEYLSTRGASMEITLDGKTKTVKLPGEDAVKGLTGADRDAAYVKAFQKSIDDAFGKGKLTVSDANGDGNGIQFQFDAPKGSTFAIGSTKGEILGFGESDRVTSYLNTGKTLGELMKGKDFSTFEKAYVLDSNGNKTNKLATDANGKQLYSFKVNGKEIGQFNEDTALSTVFNAMNSNSDSEVKVGYSKLTNELTFTAKDTGAASEIDFGDDTSMAAALFGKVDTNSEGYSAGQDAIFEASVNGTSLGEITRSSNDVEMDGMTISLKGTFGYQTDEDGNIKYDVSQAKDDKGNSMFYIYQGQGKEKQISAEQLDDGRFVFSDYKTGKTVYGTLDADGKMSFLHENGSTVYAQLDGGGNLRFTTDESQKQEMNVLTEKTAIKDTKAEGVTFETSSDADKIVDVVKQMVEDYNAMAKEIKDAYSTLPAQRSNGAYYEPLTSEDEEEMSESAVKNWTEKAKQGILFGDRDLASLYQRMTSAVSMTGEHGAALREAGITVNYSNGLTTLEFNEDKFRAALNNDPDKVRDAFTSSVESGAKSNGLMQALKQPLDIYGKTEGGKGVLVEKAGSPLAPSTMYNNTIQKELNNIDSEIERWQDKMENQIDHYTSQFSRLEQLIQQMNSQSSYFSQLMAGG
ncbi:flagellar filament capping protein FliD [uncultured Oscillibacter sp.]|uniref:flagellar filament capping protein FliD n=1 Tax=uncultured Oscillibacter sp. TaxID=876091 RepID=UPI002173C840|nr:flagellar filament capping protein FliD [uncultured Oscillibacter sp.]MCI9010972.1 flagellar filament capping protein FliD [Oscillibacter sp.]